MSTGSSTGVVKGLDILNDPLAASLFKSLTIRSQDSLMYEQVSGGTAVALARIPKNVRRHKDSKKNMLPPKRDAFPYAPPTRKWEWFISELRKGWKHTVNPPSTKGQRAQMR